MTSPTNPEDLVVPIWSGDERTVTQWLPSRSAGCLILGGEEIDRTVAIGELITRLVDGGYRVWVGGGPKVTGARAWSQRTGDESVVYAASIDDQADMLRSAWAELVARYDATSDISTTYTPLMVVISDFDVVSGFLDTITAIAWHARAVNSALVIGSASPSAELLYAVRRFIRVHVAMDDQTAQSPLLL